MNDIKIVNFINSNSALFWYLPEEQKKDISKEFLVETILNYGDIDAVRQLISLLGINEVARCFYSIINQSERKGGNIQELTKHYFNLLFEHYAHRNI